ncbi:hypothetical protein V2G26_009117 [Clonostachys chloroleuca]
MLAAKHLPTPKFRNTKWLGPRFSRLATLLDSSVTADASPIFGVDQMTKPSGDAYAQSWQCSNNVSICMMLLHTAMH